MAHDAVIVHDAVGAQNIASPASRLHGDPDVVHFQHGDMRGIEAVLIFPSADMQRQQLGFGNFSNHKDQLVLHQLVRCDRLVLELFARLGILQCRVIARHRRTNHSPADPVASLREATEGPFETNHTGQQILPTGPLAIVHRQARGNRSAQRKLAVHIPGFEILSPLFRPGRPRMRSRLRILPRLTRRPRSIRW